MGGAAESLFRPSTGSLQRLRARERRKLKVAFEFSWEVRSFRRLQQDQRLAPAAEVLVEEGVDVATRTRSHVHWQDW